jgi:hypothetical protein
MFLPGFCPINAAKSAKTHPRKTVKTLDGKAFALLFKGKFVSLPFCEEEYGTHCNFGFE